MSPAKASPTLGNLPSLATPDDIVDRLGRNLNQVEALRVDAMLRDGSAIIRRYARNSFNYIANDVLTLVSDAGKMVLPGRPIWSVSQVIAIAGMPTYQNIPVTWFIFDGIDTITIPSPRSSGIINLPAYWYNIGWWYTNSFEVTYTHGEHEVPAEVSGLLCSAIISELSTPTMSATIQAESIGAYSYSMRRREGGSGIFAALVDFGMKSVLEDYRHGYGTLAVKP